RKTRGFLELELVPNARIEFHGAPLQINRWAMRDRDYEKSKPDSVFRIACLGASHLMGGGVPDEKTFENLVEDRLNREGGIGGRRVEILNFGVDGYSAIERTACFDDKVAEFEPDVVMSFAHVVDTDVTVGRMFELIRGEIDLKYAPLREIAKRAGVDARTGEKLARKRLAEHGDEIITWAYGHLAAACRKRGALPVWVFLPRVVHEEPAAERAPLETISADAGLALLDLGTAYAGQNVKALYLADWDQHPNARGHEILAERFYRAIRESNFITPAAVEAAAR
ncbi:MAG: SGNH/GDSL hydrolase family protein, partial [bacterium]